MKTGDLIKFIRHADGLDISGSGAQISIFGYTPVVIYPDEVGIICSVVGYSGRNLVDVLIGNRIIYDIDACTFIICKNSHSSQ